MAIPETLKKKAEEILFRYPEDRRRSGLIPLLFEVQRELGWITPEAESWVVETLGVTDVNVREVITFYSMMRAEPSGKYLIQFCQNISCCLTGGEEIQKHVEHKLGIHPGETTKDGLFTLKCVECLGGCSWGPMMLINEDQYFQLTVEKLDRIIHGLKAGEPVPADNPTPLLGNVAGEKV
ncbi:MAG: NAD(P)H-dependent oxidoreductase subunit E [bacterium]|nr:NAD(P)H-dependent oxidoreductase subunit E [bacterium]